MTHKFRLNPLFFQTASLCFLHSRRANAIKLFFWMGINRPPQTFRRPPIYIKYILRPSEPSHFLMALIVRNDFTKAPALHYIAQSKNTTTQGKTKEKPPS